MFYNPKYELSVTKVSTVLLLLLLPVPYDPIVTQSGLFYSVQ